ncbi:hypothetical protein C1646_757147 [Rhizophagus diaphanus]|nr:hypothetical protein C1646_757147 [Rhizophagus diaphanus] [Rhizophagus sp. MUCL 43196]
MSIKQYPGRMERTQWCVVQPILANIKKIELTTNGASRRRGKKKERDEFIKYLTLSADGGNSTAQFNLGDAYTNGNYTKS